MNKHNWFRNIVIGVAVVLSTLAAASCDNTYGVFQDIQTETEQIGTELFKNSTVRSLGLDTTHYYAVMGKVFARTFAGEEWTLLSAGSGGGDTDYFCSGFASDGAGAIYLASSTVDYTELIAVQKSTDGGANWTAIPSTLLTGKTFDRLFWAGDTLFALAHDEAGDTFSLYHSDGSAAFASVTGVTDIDQPVLGAVKSGTTYWVLTQDVLYQGSSPGTLAEDGLAGSPSAGGVLEGIAVNGSGDLLVSDETGQLYTLAAGAWETPDEVDADVPLGIMAEIPVDPTNLAGAKRLLLAKHSSTYGYYEWDAAAASKEEGNGEDAVFCPTPSNYTTTIYNKPVLAILFSDANDTILIGLASQGTATYALYSNTYSAGVWSGWTAE